MRRTRFDEWPCPIARTTDLLGDWWTPIILREAFLGRRRFDDFQQAIGIPRAVLAQRLDRFVADGIVTKEQYEQHPPRYEYRLTDKGRDLYPVLAAMWRFGVDWLFEDGAPFALVDRDTGDEVVPRVVDERTGDPIDVRRIRLAAVPGPR